MKNSNDDKIRKILGSEPLPEQLQSDNIKKMLDENAPAKKRKKITRTFTRLTAGAAACAIICGFGMYFTEHKNDYKYKSNSSNLSYNDISESSQTAIGKVTVSPSYMSGASDYNEIYKLIECSAEKFNDTLTTGADIFLYNEMEYGFGLNSIHAADDFEEIKKNETLVNDSHNESNSNNNDKDYSETFNQENNVLEGDIARTDGKYIYYIPSWNGKLPELYLNIAEVNNGNFVSGNKIELKLPENTTTFADMNMFLYNDMLIITGCAYGYKDIDSNRSFVLAYTTGSEPQLIGHYLQDGTFSDVRISPDGYLCLITNYTSKKFKQITGCDDYSSYIPEYAINDCAKLVPPESILLPGEYSQTSSYMKYTVIGTLNLNTPGQIIEVENKALAGYTGNIYCSENNLYTICGYNYSEITRIALDKGKITPAASGKVEGYIKDQFSMSEYNGYFRIATTTEVWEDSYSNDGISSTVSHTLKQIENRVYVLDMNLEVIGSIGELGIGETIKSAVFNGNIAYIVTYEQTDPLYSIDLSNPQKPTLMDEFKILGYSSYMQNWSEGLLLGFGANANEKGIENGVKLVMFDNSDPYNLEEKGIFIMDRKFFNADSDSWIYSEGMVDRKSLLIAPSKNLIGVPVYSEKYTGNKYEIISSYIFFSYENGEFIHKGKIQYPDNNNSLEEHFKRCVYIGNYVYALSQNCFASADIETITPCDSIDF